MSDLVSYSDRQAEAPYTICLRCQKAYFSTAKRTICRDCDPMDYSHRTRPQTDVNGVEMTEP